MEEDAFETLNGLLISILDKIPSDDLHETVTKYGYNFEILHVEDRIVREVRITKCEEQNTSDDAENLAGMDK